MEKKVHLEMTDYDLYNGRQSGIKAASHYDQVI
jgi:hypothetical protein